MNWNESNGRDPWGKRPNEGPPDLDEVYRRLLAGIRGIFGGRSGGGGPSTPGTPFNPALLWIIVAVVVVVLGREVVKFVEPAERGVVLRFGNPVAVLDPGVHLRWPRPIESVEVENVDQVRSITHHASMLTQDENIVEVDMAVQYKIASVEDFLFNVRGPDATLRQATETAIREVIGTNEMDFILTSGRSEVSARTAETIQGLVNQYGAGIIVDSVNILSAKPPEQVKSAFDDAIKAREDEQRLINEAEAYRKEVVPKAQGAAARLVEEGTAYREGVTSRARGEASRFSQLLAAYRENPDVTRQRMYLDTVEQVYARSSKLLMESPKGGNANLMVLPLETLLNSRSTTGGNVGMMPGLGDGTNRMTAPEGDTASDTSSSTPAGIPEPGDLLRGRSRERTRP
jgi:modulator of FtsH protease HflK